MKRRALFLLVSSLCIAASAVFAEETITITTYYPSPYGVYNELTTTSNAYLATTGGNVGIGTTNPQAKLDVVGGVKIGDDSGTCDADKTGTLRYNSGKVQYCNGSSWMPVGGISYTYYCFNSGYGTPVCTDAGGSQGYCPSGYTQQVALGSWGECEYCSTAWCSGCVIGSHFFPPGGTCSGSGCGNTTVGQAFICSQ